MRTLWGFTTQSYHYSTIYRFNYWVNLLTRILLMYSVYWLWISLFSQQHKSFEVSLEQMITYGIIGMVLPYFLEGGIKNYIADKVQKGEIETDLIRPIDFQMHMIFRSLSTIIVNLVIFILPLMIISLLIFEVTFPRSITDIALLLFSIFFAYTISFSIEFLMGILSFITLSIQHFNWAYYTLITFLSGQMVPLWFFPDYIRVVSELLPFRCMYEIPLAIFIGKFTAWEAIQALSFQFCWGVILVSVSRYTWLKVYKRLAVQGG
ncbi:ABC-2 family transporter protein [Paenibacillus sp. 32O-W]|uniref:ABC transporter permease n=1 Tax=Paenibacillus sp. 32O-W TaxID=1695218 RepID=UPI0011A3CC80|nr:ABC-2 family transporter protein [Paenibacillus sp. 32O-W]